MKNRHWFFFAALLILPVFLAAQSGPPWVKTNTGFNYIMRGIDFPSAQNSTGFMVGESLTYMGNGIVLKSTDGGTTWSQLWIGIAEGLEGASFPDLNTGFIAGWPKLSAGWSGFGKTTNGGTTWVSVAVDPDVYYFTDVVFKDANNGILLGSTNTSPRVWATSNGGATWTVATGIISVPSHACHLSGNTYFLVDNGGRIMKSVNNGQSWTTLFSGGGTLTGIDFFDVNTGMACGADGQIIKTYDGGVTWTPQIIGSNPWHDFAWEDGLHVFLSGTPEVVLESADGGSVWENSYPQSTLQEALYECMFTANGTGFICGSGGIILKRAPSCHALFSAPSTSICAGTNVSYTNQSTGSNLTYQWTFEGGTPGTSTLANPVISYNTAGVFDVQLIVSNGSWSDTLLRENFMTVTAIPQTPVIMANGTLLTSNSATGNIWYLGGQPIPGATGQTWNAVSTGTYWDVVQENGCVSDTSNHVYISLLAIDEVLREPITLISRENPAGITWLLRFHSQRDATEILSLYNATGREVRRQQVHSGSGLNEYGIDLSGLPPGLYLVVFTSGNEQFTGKILSE